MPHFTSQHLLLLAALSLQFVPGTQARIIVDDDDDFDDDDHWKTRIIVGSVVGAPSPYALKCFPSDKGDRRSDRLLDHLRTASETCPPRVLSWQATRLSFRGWSSAPGTYLPPPRKHSARQRQAIQCVSTGLKRGDFYLIPLIIDVYTPI
ncbi:hypothetical protein B0H13DRAFT_2082558 [Mycena leptocephala]|nr:hypothetical protein B0H13DRAFT_2082558 [Mycena leptocephala]